MTESNGLPPLYIEVPKQLLYTVYHIIGSASVVVLGCVVWVLAAMSPRLPVLGGYIIAAVLGWSFMLGMLNAFSEDEEHPDLHPVTEAFAGLAFLAYFNIAMVLIVMIAVVLKSSGFSGLAMGAAFGLPMLDFWASSKNSGLASKHMNFGTYIGRTLVDTYEKLPMQKILQAIVKGLMLVEERASKLSSNIPATSSLDSHRMSRR